MRKHYILTPELANNIEAYCLSHNVGSESAFIRYALTAFFDNTARDETLILEAVRSLSQRLEKLEKTNELLFAFLRKSHENMLGYHAEIAGDYKDAAQKSARERADRFFAYFRNSLRDEPELFEALLHGYFTEERDEQD